MKIVYIFHITEPNITLKYDWHGKGTACVGDILEVCEGLSARIISITRNPSMAIIKAYAEIWLGNMDKEKVDDLVKVACEGGWILV